MPDNDKIKLPEGFKLDSDVKLPSGFTLDSDVKKKVSGEIYSLTELPSEFIEPLKKGVSPNQTKEEARAAKELGVKPMTGVAVPTNLPKQDEMRYERELKIQDAAVNTLTDIYKQKGLKFDPSKPAAQKQLQDYITKERDNDLSKVVGSKDGKEYLVRSQGFFESAGESLVRSITNPIESTSINMTNDASDLADLLDDKIKKEPNIPEATPSKISGYLGELGGGLPKIMALMAIPYVGKFAMVGEMYYNALANQRRFLYEKGLADGMDRITSAQNAMKNAPITAIPDAVVATAMARGIGGNGISNAAKESFLKAVGGGLKGVAKVSAVGGVAEFGRSKTQQAQGYKITDAEAIENGLRGAGDYAIMDAAFKLAHAGPKYLSSAAKNVLSSIPKEIVEVAANSYPDGKQTLEEVQIFANTKAKVADFVPESKVASVTGLTEKTNNLKKDIEALEENKKAVPSSVAVEIDNQIKDKNKEVEFYDNQIKKVLNSKDETGISEEIDDVTGEKIGAKKYIVDGKEVSQEEFEALQGKPIGTKEIITAEVELVETYEDKVKQILINQSKAEGYRYMGAASDLAKIPIEDIKSDVNEALRFFKNQTVEGLPIKTVYRLKAEFEAKGYGDIPDGTKLESIKDKIDSLEPSEGRLLEDDIYKRRKEELDSLSYLPMTIKDDMKPADKKKVQDRREDIKKINDKYDAELGALKVKPVVEAKEEVKPTEDIYFNQLHRTEKFDDNASVSTYLGHNKNEKNIFYTLPNKGIISYDEVIPNTNRFTITANAKNDTPADIKNAFKRIEKYLPANHELLENKSISVDGLKVWDKFIKDKKYIKTGEINEVQITPIDKANIFKDLKYTTENKWSGAKFENKGGAEALARVEKYIKDNNLDFKVKLDGDVIKVEVPVLKYNPTKEVKPTEVKPSEEKDYNTLYHNSLNQNLKLEDIDLLRKGQSQLKRSMKDLPEELQPSGFYTTDDVMSRFMGGTSKYSFKFPKNAKVKDLAAEGRITDRLGKKELIDLRNQGYDIIKGKNMAGQQEFIPLNKELIKDWKYEGPNIKKENGKYYYTKVTPEGSVQIEVPENIYESIEKNRFEQTKEEVKPIEVKAEAVKLKVEKQAEPKTLSVENKEYTTKTGRQKVVLKDNDLKVIDIKTGKEASPATRRKALDEYVERYDFSKGKTAQENTKEAPQGLSSEEVDRFSIEQSENPLEIASAYVYEEPISKFSSSKDAMIAEFGVGKITQESFKRWKDKNFITGGMALTYFNKKEGTPLDVLAKEMSDHFGKEIDPQDIAEFIVKYPSGSSAALRDIESPTGRMAAERFKELTGLDLYRGMAEKIVKAEYDKKKQIEKDLIKEEYETAKQLEDAYWAAYKETDGFTKESPVSKVKPTEAPEKGVEEAYKDLTINQKRQIINSKFDELLKELKIEKICPT